MKRFLLAVLVAMMAKPACAAPETPRLSRSKLSIHLIGRYTQGAREVVRSGPRVLKILDLGDEMRAAFRDYKTRFPRGIVVLRIYTRMRFSLKDDATQSARRFWDEALWPPLQKLPPAERKMIDYLEGPNEGDSTPCWKNLEETRWFTRFWIALAPLMKRHGFRPCAGSIPVGNPPDIEAQIAAFSPALRVVQRCGGVWSYHAYSIRYSTDVAVENWYALRYRRFLEVMRKTDPALARLPLILSEGGVDESGDPQKSGFAARGAPEKYEKWLAWFDAELRKDASVLGVTLFQSGDATNWPSFDIESVAPWLAAHLRETKDGASTHGSISDEGNKAAPSNRKSCATQSPEKCAVCARNTANK